MNQAIKAEKVLVISDEGEKLGIMLTSEAVRKAQAKKKDLVMMSDAEVPVCKIMDYNKWRFEQKRKKQQNKQSKVVIKELKFRPVIAEGDYAIKVKQITKFINEGARVKITITFKRRELTHQDIGEALVERLLTSLEGMVNVDQMPKLEGLRINFTLVPIKK